MGEIDMLGGSNFHMDRGGDDPASQHGGGGGEIDMFGGGNLSMSHNPLPSEQKKKGMGGIEMVGEQGLIRGEATPYGSMKPTDKGTE